MAWQHKLLARGGKLLTTGGKAIVLTDANESAVEACCCDPCASGCGYIDLAGPWGVWRLNRRGDLDPDNPDFYDYFGDDGQAGIGADGAGFAAWDVGRLHCSFQVSCDGHNTAIACSACYDLDSYDPAPCPGLSLAGGCYAHCCACCASYADLPASITATWTHASPYFVPASISGTMALQADGSYSSQQFTLAYQNGCAYAWLSAYASSQITWSSQPPGATSYWMFDTLPAMYCCEDGCENGRYPFPAGRNSATITRVIYWYTTDGRVDTPTTLTLSW